MGLYIPARTSQETSLLNSGIMSHIKNNDGVWYCERELFWPSYKGVEKLEQIRFTEPFLQSQAMVACTRGGIMLPLRMVKRHLTHSEKSAQQWSELKSTIMPGDSVLLSGNQRPFTITESGTYMHADGKESFLESGQIKSEGVMSKQGTDVNIICTSNIDDINEIMRRAEVSCIHTVMLGRLTLLQGE